MMDKLNAYICTFNCAREQVQPEVFGDYLLSAPSNQSSPPDVLILCLQEIAPIAYSFLGGSFLSPYFNALRKSVKYAVKDKPYVNMLARNIGLTAIMVFVRSELVPSVKELQVGQVGVGVREMGNKGAVGVRLFYELESGVLPLTFLSCHLAPMEDALYRRNEDYQNIVRRLVFAKDSSGRKGVRNAEVEDAPLLQDEDQVEPNNTCGIYDSTAYLFVAGDLNYRTSERSPTDEEVKTFPQPTKNKADPHHFSHLLQKDQLSKQVVEGKTIHGLVEMPITFPPTYKYKNKMDQPVLHDGEQPWKWATHRWPSWCDRIFMSDNVKEVHNYTSLPLFATSDHRPVVLSFSIPLTPQPDSRLAALKPYGIDSNWKARRDTARRKEVVVGLLAYFGLTWEGRGLLIATTLGAIGGWLVFRSLLIT